MEITARARDKLAKMLAGLGDDVGGLRIDGFVGTCRGSSPVLKPVQAAAEGDTEVQANGVRIFIAPDYAELLANATLDFDPSFMGRGLAMSWPHREGCPCQALAQERREEE